MLLNDSEKCQEIETLLGAYALDALDAREAAVVEGHLSARGGCSRCRRALAELQAVTALLGRSVGQQVPPAHLRSRLLRELGAETPRASPTVSDFAGTSRHGPLRMRLAVPLVACLVVVLLAASLAMNFRVSQRVEWLERENSALNDRLLQSATVEALVLERLHQMRATAYMMAAPGTAALPLESISGSGSSHGVLLVSRDGHRAILMVTGMSQPPDTMYQVWLVRPGESISAGEMIVDSAGWGSTILGLPESVYRFDWVILTAKGMADNASASSSMVMGVALPPRSR